MGSPDDVGERDERPAHEVTLDAFWIGLTEVTNAQYRLFVEAGGYRQREWWTEAAWARRAEFNIIQPRYWNDEAWNQAEDPVVGVSWYEAVAYAKWLAQATGWDIRLPSEAEWERAARGDDQRTYPWGDEAPTNELLNYGGVISSTTATGSYSQGASPYGGLDMAGNVWEWTSSMNHSYPYRSDDGREELEGSTCCRVRRGGSWHDSLLAVRVANRTWDGPGHRNNDVGIRFVMSAPQ
jgi:formylglycine-generating enzyme required for sulfatase activity